MFVKMNQFFAQSLSFTLPPGDEQPAVEEKNKTGRRKKTTKKHTHTLVKPRARRLHERRWSVEGGAGRTAAASPNTRPPTDLAIEAGEGRTQLTHRWVIMAYETFKTMLAIGTIAGGSFGRRGWRSGPSEASEANPFPATEEPSPSHGRPTGSRPEQRPVLSRWAAVGFHPAPR